LLSQNLGLKVEARYRMSYLFKGDSDLRHSYEGRTDTYDLTTQQGTIQAYDAFEEVSEVQRLNLGLEFSAGVIGYW
jgi:hypothetical protein